MSTSLVLGGTGPLRGVVAALVARGDRVVVPSRSPSDDASWEVAADWSDPTALASAVADQAGAIDHAVVWCWDPYRSDVTAAVRAVLSPDGVVIQVLSASTLTHLWEEPAHPDVVWVMLGHRQLDDGTSRGLTDEEIGAGVVSALGRPLGSTLVVGSLD